MPSSETRGRIPNFYTLSNNTQRKLATAASDVFTPPDEKRARKAWSPLNSKGWLPKNATLEQLQEFAKIAEEFGIEIQFPGKFTGETAEEIEPKKANAA